MRDPGNLKVAAHGDRQIVMTRDFDARRELALSHDDDPIRPFSEACRIELASLRRAG